MKPNSNMRCHSHIVTRKTHFIQFGIAIHILRFYLNYESVMTWGR